MGAVMGVNLRYYVDAIAGQALFETIVVNSIGSFILAFLIYSSSNNTDISKNLKHLIAIGFCASFTSYSTFICETNIEYDFCLNIRSFI